MAFSPGTRLGVYEVGASIGAGGMGEVYRARDTRLNRAVAIKALPSAFAVDAERLARFRREAQVLASLNHPHIGSIYGLEEVGEITFLILELVEGETLAERIARGPVPAHDALEIARQIAEALEAAHEKGIVHRDLKPANVAIGPDGSVKVLDFGLAKPADASPSAASATYSPTLSLMATQAGVILGTAAYMSPEQAKGLPADHRSDVFSLGCVLYEMLTGRQPFQGDTAPDVLASVLARDPDLTTLPGNLNPRVHELVRRCLEKHPKRRWQAMGDLRAELEIVAAAPIAPKLPSSTTPRRRWAYVALTSLLALASVGLGLVVGWRTTHSASPEVVRLMIPLPDGQSWSLAANTRRVLDISRDGKHVVYTASGRLFVRTLSQFETQSSPVTESMQVQNPVFSPDGQEIAFYSVGDQALMRVATAGGPLTRIARLAGPAGMSWGDSGILVGRPRAVLRLNRDGGEPEQLVKLNANEAGFAPQMLPGGRAVLFTLLDLTSAIDTSTARVVVQPLPAGQQKLVIDGASDARYLPTGHIVYAVGGVLFAKRFDLDRLEAVGAAMSVIQGVDRGLGNVGAGIAQYAVSDTGVLIYRPGPATMGGTQLRSLVRIDRAGKATPLKVAPALYEHPRISPDRTHVAFDIQGGGKANVYVYDLSGARSMRQLTFEGVNRFPIWASNERIVFQSNYKGDLGMWWQRADGGGVAERLTTAEKGAAHVPESVLPHTDTLSYSLVAADGVTLHLFSIAKRKDERFDDVHSPSPLNSVFSPDGHWIAYTDRSSAVAGGLSAGIYVQPVPSTGIKYFVGAGHHPEWSPVSSRLLYFPGADQLSSVEVTTSGGFEHGDPMPIPGAFVSNTSGESGRNHDTSNDGAFIIAAMSPQEAPGAGSEVRPQQPIAVVLNWFEELRQRVPSK